jgi:cellulose synthase/poly-beta-1,6-N-acetylglucosamine synthase-like glycosyltransferase
VKSFIKVNNAFYNAGDLIKPSLANGTNNLNPQALLFPADVTSQIQSAMGKTNDQSIAKMTDWTKYQNCLNKMFYVGSGMNGLSSGSTGQCSLWNIPLSIFVIPLCLIILKSLLSLRPALGTTRHKCQENCIIMIPCFNETLQELKTSVNGVVEAYHPDHAKLLMIVCDGVTSLQSVLSIVGYQGDEPETKGYQSLGSGNKSLNFAKVYSGFYYHGSHGVPYLIVAKTGNLAERELNGNRGKRDSMMILLNFLDGISAPDNLLTPLEAEIAINLRKLEIRIEKFPYLMVVDADTYVDPNSLPSMLGYLEARPKYMAVSGQLQLTGGLNPFLTLMSQYHNFVTRHLSMVAANRLSSLTQTNGAFCVFRLHQITGEKCLTHEGTVSRLTYKRTSTLHTKHAVMLGEDVFISTLLLQRWPNSKIGYLPTVTAKTLAPSAFGQIVKKERANISIRFHNLIELWRTSSIMGLSLVTKFWVLLELLWILLMPAFCLYSYWILLRALFLEPQQWVVAGAFMIVAFALAILNPLIELKLNYLVGFFLYLTVGLPFYYFFLPLYTFLTQDDFLWCDVGGDQTRMRPHGTYDNASTDQGRQRFSLSQYEKPPSSDTSYVSFGQDVLPNPNYSSLYTEFKQMGMLSPRSADHSMMNPFGNQQANGNEHLPMTELNRADNYHYNQQRASNMTSQLQMTQINSDLSGISLNSSSMQQPGILIDNIASPSSQGSSPLNMNNFPMPPSKASSPTIFFDKTVSSQSTTPSASKQFNNQSQQTSRSITSDTTNNFNQSGVPFTPASRFEFGSSVEVSSMPNPRVDMGTRNTQVRSIAISEYDSDFSSSVNSLANAQPHRMSTASAASIQSRRATMHQNFHKDDDDDFHQSEELIRDEIRYLLQYADLNKTTRREVKEHLLVVFGENVAYYQDFINKCIEEFTLEKLALSSGNTSFAGSQ